MSTEIISLRMPKALKARLEKAAEREGRTVSGFVRHHLGGLVLPKDAPTQPRKGGAR